MNRSVSHRINVLVLFASVLAVALGSTPAEAAGVARKPNFVVVPAVLGLTAGIAAYVPARRAARLNPVTALRVE